MANVRQKNWSIPIFLTYSTACTFCIVHCTVYNSFCTFEAKSKLYRFEQHPCNVGTAFNYSYETYIYQIQPENCWIVEKSNEGEIVVILGFFGCWGINTAPASALLQSDVIVIDLNALKFQTSSQAQNYARRLQPKNYDWLTHSLTGVKCRATSVAKKYFVPGWYSVYSRTPLVRAGTENDKRDCLKDE